MPCVVVAAASCLLTLNQASDADTGSAPEWKLVYERYDAKRGIGGTGIEIVSASQTRSVTIARKRNSSESYLFPAWSPDGRYVAFDGRIGERQGLFVVRAGGGRPTLVASEKGFDFAWSPDGKRLAFVAGCDVYSPSDGLKGCANGRVEVAPREGGPSAVVARLTGGRASSFISLLEWSPDGTRLLVGVAIRKTQRLVSVNVRGGTQLVLADSRADGDLGEASWSSDGSLVAFKRHCRDNRADDTFCDLAVIEV